MTNVPICLNMTKFTLIPACLSYWFACSCAATRALALLIGGSTLVGWSSRLDLGVLGGSKLGSLYSESGVSGVWVLSGVTGVWVKLLGFEFSSGWIGFHVVFHLFVFHLLAGGCYCLLRLFFEETLATFGFQKFGSCALFSLFMCTTCFRPFWSIISEFNSEILTVTL